MKEGINIMKLMISQPMRGKTNKQIREERAELVSGLQEEGNEVIDTVFENAPAQVTDNIKKVSRNNTSFRKKMKVEEQQNFPSEF